MPASSSRWTRPTLCRMPGLRARFTKRSRRANSISFTKWMKLPVLDIRKTRPSPRVSNLKDEPEHVRKMYGLDGEKTREFGERCLSARRLVEQGVRFVQVYHGGG